MCPKQLEMCPEWVKTQIKLPETTKNVSKMSRTSPKWFKTCLKLLETKQTLV